MPALVLLHGYAGRPEGWRAVQERLPPGRVVVAAPLPGHDPLAPLPQAGLRSSYEAALAAYAETLESLAGVGLHLAGYSLGARIALGLLARYPGRYAGATLIGVNPGLRSEAARLERARSDAAWAQRLRSGGIDRFVAAWEAQPIFATQAALPEALRAAQRALRRSHDPSSLAACLERLGLAATPSLWPALPAITAPIHLIAGAEDPAYAAIAEEMLTLLPDARLTLVPGAGHNPVLEAPQQIAALLTDPDRKPKARSEPKANVGP